MPFIFTCHICDMSVQTTELNAPEVGPTYSWHGVKTKSVFVVKYSWTVIWRKNVDRDNVRNLEKITAYYQASE